MWEREFGQKLEASASSVNGDLQGRIEAAYDYVVEENAECQPEPRAIQGALRLKGHNRAARIVHRGWAVFFGQVGCYAVQIVCA